MADPQNQARLTPDTSGTNDQNLPQSTSTDRDLDADLEMEDDATHNHQTQQGQDTSSSTLDHEPTTRTDTLPLQQGEQGGEQQGQQPNSSPQAPPLSRKDASLREFLSKMDEYAPIIPDAVTAHYLTVSGLPPPNPSDPTGITTNATPLPLARLLALATQKFIADIAADAYQYSRIRASNTASSASAAAAATMPGTMGAQAGATAAGAAGAGGGDKGKGGAFSGGPQLGVARAGYGGGGMGGSGQGRTVLTMEDLGMAVGEYGVNVRRGEFYR